MLPERFWEEITNDANYKNRNLIFQSFEQVKPA